MLIASLIVTLQNFTRACPVRKNAAFARCTRCQCPPHKCGFFFRALKDEEMMFQKFKQRSPYTHRIGLTRFCRNYCYFPYGFDSRFVLGINEYYEFNVGWGLKQPTPTQQVGGQIFPNLFTNGTSSQSINGFWIGLP